MNWFERLDEALAARLPGLKVVENEPMSRHTSFRIGGPARRMAFPDGAEQLVRLMEIAAECGVRPLVIGKGSNLLAADAGLDRLVIDTSEDMTKLEEIESGILRAEAGVSLGQLAVFAQKRGLTGLEFAHGIPGTVGGGIYMNAGAYGGELCQVAVATTALLPDGTVWEAEGDAQDFSYRNSGFQKKGAVVLRSRFRLQPGDREQITARMQELAEKRRASQPLEKPSAGSTFKRPVGGFAAALIDQAGLKGKGVGGVAVSEKHAGFVVNLGGATAADVLATMELVQKEVWEHSGIQLEPEVRIW